MQSKRAQLPYSHWLVCKKLEGLANVLKLARVLAYTQNISVTVRCACSKLKLAIA